MRVLLVGGNGFLGRRVRLALEESGHQVAVTRSRVAPGRHHTSLHLDLADPQSIDRLNLVGFDAVCNLGARIQPLAAAEPEWHYEVNAFGAERLARLAAQGERRRFVHISTGNAYALDEKQPTEQSPLFPTGPAHRYLSSKVAGEILVSGVAKRSGMPVAVLRPSAIYGVGMGRSVVTAFIDRAIRDETLVVSDGGRHEADFVHVDDVARCVVDALESGDSGAFNVGSGTATTTLELARLIVDVFGSESTVQVEGIEAEEPTGFPPLDIARASRLWGFSPRSLRDGLLSMRERQGGQEC